MQLSSLALRTRQHFHDYRVNTANELDFDLLALKHLLSRVYLFERECDGVCVFHSIYI